MKRILYAILIMFFSIATISAAEATETKWTFQYISEQIIGQPKLWFSTDADGLNETNSIELNPDGSTVTVYFNSATYAATQIKLTKGALSSGVNTIEYNMSFSGASSGEGKEGEAIDLFSGSDPLYSATERTWKLDFSIDPMVFTNAVVGDYSTQLVVEVVYA